MTEALLHHLRQRASRRGLVITRAQLLQEALGVSLEDLERSLTDLEAKKQLRVLSPLPYLVCTLHSWPGSSTPPVTEPQQSSSDSSIVHREIPVSSAAAAASAGVGGPGEGGALLDEVLAVLGPEAIREEFVAILAPHGAALIRRCLRRVQATRSIRVSRAALFRSLLRRLAN